MRPPALRVQRALHLCSRRLPALLRAFGTACLLLAASLPAQQQQQQQQQKKQRDLACECQAWSMHEGLPQSYVTAVQQAADGSLWLGTFGGLVQFDGGVMQVFDVASHPDLRSDRIVSLCATRDGALWIGTEDQGLVSRRDGVFTQPEAAAVIPRSVIWQLHEGRDDRLWVCSNAGLWWIDRDRHRATRVEGIDDAARGVVEAADGALWVATDHALLILRDGAPQQVAEARFRAIHLDGEGTVWTGQRSGRLVRWDADARPLVELECKSSVDAITADGTGGIWVATARPLRWQNDRVEHVELPPTTGEVRARAALFDREGNLWFGGNGLFRLRPTPLVGVPLDTAAHPPRTVCADPGGRLWVTTYDDRLLCGVDGDLRAVAPDEVRVHTVAPTGDGALWAIGSRQLWHIAAGGDRRELLAPQLPAQLRRALLEDRRGDLWAGEGAELVRWRAATLRAARATADGAALEVADRWRPIDGLPGGEVLALLEVDDDTMWVGCAQGLCRIVDGAVERVWRRGQELPHGDVRALCASRLGGLWVGTYGGGICHVGRDDAVVPVPRSSGLFETAISRIATDGRGNLVLQGNRALVFVSERELEEIVTGREQLLHAREYRRGTGIGTYEGSGGYMPLAATTPDGMLWFAALEGLVRFDPGTPRDVVPPPPVRIERISVDGVELTADTGGLRTASPGPRDLAIDFAAATFIEPARIRYRYRLEGYRDGWVDAGARRQAIFTSVPPGDYVFRVQASSPDGRWHGAGQTARLRLQPRLLETAWATALLWLLATVAAAVGLGLCARRARARADRLERLVAERTTELSLARDELEERVEQRTRELGAALTRARNELRERELLERRLVEAQKLEAVGRLAGGIAHDFNNILTVVVGEANHGLDGVPDDAPVREPLQQIVESCRRASSLTKQLLAYSSNQLLQPEVIDVDASIQGLRNLLRRLVRADIELAFELDADGGMVRVDPGQLEQVIVNLVANAADATPAGGRIVVATRRIAADDDRADDRRGPHVEIRVTDTGSGIDAAIVDQVFEPFFTTKGAAGTGLGLASVQGVVRQSGGHVELRSAPGEGTTLCVRLPRVEAPAAAPTRRDDDDAPVAGRATATVLICDDDPSVLRIAHRTLEGAGYQVLSAPTPHDAIRIAERHEGDIDLIVTDLVMPQMSGRELASELLVTRGDAAVLFISGYSSEPVATEAELRTRSDLLLKPFEPQTLARRARDLLARSASGS